MFAIFDALKTTNPIMFTLLTQRLIKHCYVLYLLDIIRYSKIFSNRKNDNDSIIMQFLMLCTTEEDEGEVRRQAL